MTGGVQRVMEVRDFCFRSVHEVYGFVNVGPKVCEVVPGSLAEKLGVKPGWVIAAIANDELRGAIASFSRRVPAVTTDEVRSRLRAARDCALVEDASVEVVFWTDPAPIVEVPPDPEERYSANTVDQLKDILVSKYGSVVAAWDGVLDKDHSGELDYEEFVAACREVGLAGSLRSVYRELDKDGNGTISLVELDPLCQVDFTKGRCSICTLPNPCSRHDPKTQQEHLLALRKMLQDKKASKEREALQRVGTPEGRPLASFRRGASFKNAKERLANRQRADYLRNF